MLKTTVSFQVLVANKMLAANKVDSIESGKLTQKSIEPKSKKLSKSQKSAKSKKLSKIENSPNFSAKEAGPSFLTSNARKTFNCLWLVFTKAPIL